MHDDPGDLRAVLADARRIASAFEGGAPAAYIPELAAVDATLFGLAACDPEGRLVGIGDDAVPFTLQSISKPFVYGWALDELGADVVHARVGVEPTGQAFDSMVRLAQESALPHNPMVNAGALAITGLLVESGADLSALLAKLGACAGREALTVDVPVWLSERGTGHRNRAIAHLLAHHGVLTAPVDATLDLYFRQCAALVTCRDLAVMGATLAAHGRCPATGEQVFTPRSAQRVLAVMSTCGVYDASGRFQFDVGLPAKTGVAGGIVAVAPRRLSLAGYAPPVDEYGTSVRGRAAVAAVGRRLALHVFEPERAHPDAARVPDGPTLEAAVDAALAAAAAAPPAGRVADYAPQLARARDGQLALAVCTTDGTVVARGDAREPFSLQSAANALGYARVHEAVGADAVHARVGVEPSGNPFHAIVFDPRSHRPYNPLGNAGAIAVADLAPGADAAERLRGLLGFLSSAAGEPVAVDAALLDAEWAAGQRNRAIAALLTSHGQLEREAEALELYLQQCSVTVDAVRLARLAALFANGGTPIGGGSRLLGPRAVRDTLSVMASCGLHDGSGAFAWSVGLPAKSGISGALFAVVPGRLGLCAWSPAVDRFGTSVRGAVALRELSTRLDLGVFAAPGGRPG